MTTPTGPDDDRLRAAIARLEEAEHICLSCGLRGRHGRDCPAPQQPPAQEREACEGCGMRPPVPCSWWCPVESAARRVRIIDQLMHHAPPSEADSAGEDEVKRLAVVLRDVNATCDASTMHDRWTTLARAALAASSGVRVGDDQARERLADVLATCDVLDRVSDADDMTGPFGRDAARIRRAAVETIRRAAGGGRP